MNSAVHKRIYKTALDALSGKSLSHNALLDEITQRLYSGIGYDGRIGEFTEIRGLIGSVVSEMRDIGVIVLENDTYSVSGSGPIALKLESCEKEILELLKSGAKTKQQIRTYLQRIYATDKTASSDDDRMLFDYMGGVLRRLVSDGKIAIANGKYDLCDETRANIDDINAILKLKESFLTRVHRKGGEFFEHYIMTLLRKHQERYGKTVLECRTTGGAFDGGIDGIIKTKDPLGFMETTMIQAKNRTDLTTETTVRGFYGAVCAMGGSRGIFATTSDFHPGAKIFLSGIDNCVGINGDDIFKMACDCLYGIKKHRGKLLIDNKIL